jgi:hypothetical protein
MVLFCDDDVWMVDVELSGELGAGPRKRRSTDERRRVVEETLEAGASVARVALKYGVNANQVFQWRRLYTAKLGPTPESAMKLLPVTRFVFRGRRGDILKVLWFDGDGLCLLAKRLERGRFVWPQTANGTVSLSRAQLSMLLERINWRAPIRTSEPMMSV